MANGRPRIDEIDPLLVRIARQGWTARLAEEFEREYGKRMRRVTLIEMSRLGVIQLRLNPERVHRLPSPQPDLFHDVISDLWIEFLEGLVSGYVERFSAGKIHAEFMTYMGGVIRKLVIANARNLGLLGHETPAEMLRSICETKTDRAKTGKIAWAKYYLEHTVRLRLLQLCSGRRFDAVYRYGHRMADFFFEKFVPEHCAEVMNTKRSPLDRLLDLFAADAACLEAALTYVGTVTPYGGWSTVEGGDKMTRGEYESEFQRFLEEEGQ